MAGYTHINLKQVEDMAPKFGLSPGLESRFARKVLQPRCVSFNRLREAPEITESASEPDN